MKLIGLFLIFISTNLAAQVAVPEVLAHFRINGTTNPEIIAGEPVNLEIWFSDRNTGENFTDLILTEGKMMHLQIVRDDLAIIKSVYPYYDPTTGRFQITLNMPNTDPDNFAAMDALSVGGSYKIIADIESSSVGKRTAHISVGVNGEFEYQDLMLDPVDADFSITKFYKLNTNEYKVKMSHSIIVGCFGFIADFNLDIQLKNAQGEFEPLADISPMFNFGGHSIWMSEPVITGPYIHFLRVAAEMPLEAGKLVFRFNDRNILAQGVQKIWFKLKHNNEVISFPYIFEYYPPIDGANDDCNSKQSMPVGYQHF